MRLQYTVPIGFIAFALFQSLAHGQVPAAVPDYLPDDLRTGLIIEKNRLDQDHADLFKDATAHNRKCTGVTAGTALDRECAAEQSNLKTRKANYYASVRSFNRRVAAAGKRTPESHGLPMPETTSNDIDSRIAEMKGVVTQLKKAPSPEEKEALWEKYQRLREAYDQLIFDRMKVFGKKMGWSADEQTRFNKALDELGDFKSDASATPDNIDKAWNNMLARSGSTELAKEASQGGGPGFPGAGQQTRYNDCVVFALANATGRPYGVVGAAAGELIRNSDWHSTYEQTHPDQAIERRGLNGGEVVALAQNFGKANIVLSGAFADTLKSGRPILVDVSPPGAEGGHEVVLTKAFSHQGQTWYELMDSNQGPIRRLYLSDSELHSLLKENGVAFSPDTGRTPKLLR